MKNPEIRMMILQSGFKYYQVASQLGISESYFSRLLRDDLSQEWKDRITAAVNDMKECLKNAV